MLKYSKAQRIYDKDDKQKLDIVKVVNLIEWPESNAIAIEINKLQVQYDNKTLTDKAGREKSLIWLKIDEKKEIYRLNSGLNYNVYPSLDASLSVTKAIYQLFIQLNGDTWNCNRYAFIYLYTVGRCIVNACIYIHTYKHTSFICSH